MSDETHFALVMFGISLGCLGLVMLGWSTDPRRTYQSRVLSRSAGTAIVGLLLVVLVAISFLWLSVILMVGSALIVSKARTLVRDHQKAGTDPTRPRMVMIAMCVVVPFLICTICSMSPFTEGAKEVYFMGSGFVLVTIATSLQILVPFSRSMWRRR